MAETTSASRRWPVIANVFDAAPEIRMVGVRGPRVGRNWGRPSYRKSSHSS
jgi:hypothetical protein